MTPTEIYYSLPYPLRVAAASLRGYHFRISRYGSTSDELVEEAFQREAWSEVQWKEWQEKRTADLLDRAARQVPFYRRLWAERRRAGDQRSWEVLDHWPVLKKEALRSDPQAFVADNCSTKSMIPEPTSGTTGTPLKLWRTRTTQRRWYALHEARVLRWNGLSRRSRWANLGGRLVVPFDQSSPPFWVWNAGLRQLYLSSHHLTPENAAHYIRALEDHEVEYLLAYASAVYTLAGFVLDQNLRPSNLRLIVSNAEPLYDYQRRRIEEAFGCSIRNTYGMGEIAAAASECTDGTMHIWPEVGVVEVLADDGPERVAAGETGRLILTGLLNVDMPLIRYEVGDRGALDPHQTRCSCGRTLPALMEVEGRLDEVIRTRDGRTIGRLDPVFKADIPIREAQIIQESLDGLRLRIVPADGYDSTHQESIARRLRDRVGDVEIKFDLVDRLPRTPGGKVRGVISNL